MKLSLSQTAISIPSFGNRSWIVGVHMNVVREASKCRGWCTSGRHNAGEVFYRPLLAIDYFPFAYYKRLHSISFLYSFTIIHLDFGHVPSVWRSVWATVMPSLVWKWSHHISYSLTTHLYFFLRSLWFLFPPPFCHNYCWVTALTYLTGYLN